MLRRIPAVGVVKRHCRYAAGKSRRPEQLQNLQGQDQYIQNQLERKKEELASPIRQKIKKAIDEVACENGYTYVLAKEVVYKGPPADDLLPLIKRKLGLK